MRKNNLIIDFETMSDRASACAAIDCAVLYFDAERFTSDQPYSFKSLFQSVEYFKLDVKNQVVDHKFEVSEGTVKFWSQQNEDVRKRIAPKNDDLSVEEFADNFIAHLGSLPKIDTPWARATNFDATVLERLAAAAGRTSDLNEYLMHWRWRDVRTYIDAMLDFPKVNSFIPVKDAEFFNAIFKQHDCRYDVVADVLRLQALERSQNDMEMVNR